MSKKPWKTLSLFALLALLFSALPLAPGAEAVSPDLVISQVYGGGGNTGATYTHDFVELFNRGNTPVSLAGWSVQYASATGISWAVTSLSGTVAPGQYYLIRQAQGTGGTTSLPTPDATGSVAMSATAGKVALVNTATALTGSCPTGGSIIDFVGFGSTANCFEGSGPTATLTNTTAARRLSNGCVETDNNSTDFTVGAPIPRNTASPLAACAGPDPKINEFSASTAGTDVEYVEIIGDPNTSYSAYTALEIEGDAGAGPGTIDEVISLGATDANGLYLVNLTSSALENGTITLLLVKNFTGALSTDLDTNDDGVFDATPWEAIVDSVAVNDGSAPGDITYGLPALGVAYDGLPFAPGGASRIPDGMDTDTAADWVRNDFDLAGISGFAGTPIFGEAFNTPGALNAAVPPPVPQLVINEVDYDQPSADTAEFVEIKNNGSSAVSLGGWSLELVNGSGGGALVYNTIALPAVSLAAGDYFVVCANAATVANCDQDASPDTDFIQNGAPDAVGLRYNGQLKDAVSYEGNSGAPYTEGSGSGLVDTAAVAEGIARCPDGADTNVNNIDFVLAPITPGAANGCGGAAPQLSVNDVSLAEGNSGTTTFTFVVSLSAPAGAGGVTFDIATADNTATSPSDFTAQSLTGQTIAAGNTAYTFDVPVNGDTANEPDETFFVNVSNVTGAIVADGQGQGAIVNDDAAVTFIHDIQGSGSAVTGAGPFAVEAIVVGDYQAQGSGQLLGFFLQEEDADVDANPATSEGIFVFCSSCPASVSVGDKVRVTGGASEFFGMSQLTASTAGSVSVLSSGNPLPSPASVELPVPGVPSGDLAAATAAINAYFEPFEGMLVTFPDALAVSEYFELARYGQVILSEGGRPHTFTAVNTPSATGLIDHEIGLASRTIILDDSDNRQNRPVDTPNSAYYHPVPGLSTGNYFRGGDTITNLTGVLHWSFAGQTNTDAWRIRPVTEAYSYAFTPANPRPALPTVAGRLKVASFNVLNYFLTIDTTASNDSGSCGPSGTLDCRGADSAQELARQRTKLLAALSAIDADVYGFMEMENTPGVQPLADIVAGLPGYAYIDTGAIGADAIRVGIIYKTATVQPVGAYAILDSSVDPRFIDTRNRPALAQTFEENATGARFTVVVNHLKSKGSGCGLGDDDTTTGQGNCNGTRTLAAQALADWLATDPTGSGDSDVLIIGDLNSYAKEDPIVALQSAGYTDLVAAFGGPSAYGYVFDGQLGYLDHALSNPSLTPQVTGVAEWHINADEIPLFDYNDDVRDPGERDAFEEESDVLPLYEANAFRTSDHDPVIVGLDLRNDPPVADAGGPYSANEGDTIILSATGSDPDGTPVSFAWDLDNNGSFETPGQTASFLAIDGAFDYLVSVQVTDATGQSTVASATVSVLNVAPTVGPISAPLAPVAVGETVAISADFADPGVLDTHTAAIDWGDGAMTAGVVNEANGSGTASGSYAYAAPGIYTLTLTVTDKDGGSDSESYQYVVVYDPNGGFVTGGGWIDSPAGAYRLDPALSGRATFGFVARYQRGQSVPDGNTQFRFHAGGLAFQSTSYQWLIVNQNGANAQFKGAGTINGAGDYGFMIWAGDGNPDTFRIKIWSGADENAVVYDNGMDQPIDGGAIQIHRR